mgnify:CR=1 FL=1
MPFRPHIPAVLFSPAIIPGLGCRAQVSPGGLPPGTSQPGACFGTATRFGPDGVLRSVAWEQRDSYGDTVVRGEAPATGGGGIELRYEFTPPGKLVYSEATDVDSGEVVEFSTKVWGRWGVEYETFESIVRTSWSEARDYGGYGALTRVAHDDGIDGEVDWFEHHRYREAGFDIEVTDPQGDRLSLRRSQIFNGTQNRRYIATRAYDEQNHLVEVQHDVRRADNTLLGSEVLSLDGSVATLERHYEGDLMVWEQVSSDGHQETVWKTYTQAGLVAEVVSSQNAGGDTTLVLVEQWEWDCESE